MGQCCSCLGTPPQGKGGLETANGAPRQGYHAAQGASSSAAAQLATRSAHTAYEPAPPSPQGAQHQHRIDPHAALGDEHDETALSSETFYSAEHDEFLSCRGSFTSTSTSATFPLERTSFKSKATANHHDHHQHLQPGTSHTQVQVHVPAAQPAQHTAELHSSPASETAARGAHGAAIAASSGPPARAKSAPGVMEVLKKAAHIYKKHRQPCVASKVLLQYCEGGEQPKDEAAKALVAEVQQAPAEVLEVNHSTMARLANSAQSMVDALSCVTSDEGWQVVRDDALKLMYRHEAGSVVHRFKGKCILDAPIEQPLALAREFDLVKTWNHYVTESVVLREYSPVELVCLAILWLPWPLHNANVLVTATGVELLQEAGAFLVTFQTPEKMPDGVELPANARNNTKIRMLPGSCMHFEPLPPAKPGGPLRTRATVQAYVDAGMKHVPGFVITFVLKVLGPFIYSQVVKLLKNNFKDPKQPLPTRIRERDILYSMVRTRASAYLASKEQQQQQQQGAPSQAQQQQQQQGGAKPVIGHEVQEEDEGAQWPGAAPLVAQVQQG